MEHIHGLLRIHVRRGFSLAIRDITSSDPYVVVQMGKQKLKNRVVKKNLNPEWNDHLTLSIFDPALPIHLMVYDKVRFSLDDKMGDADIHIGPFLEALRSDKLGGLLVGTVVARIQPSRDICLGEESCIVRDDQGGLNQSMILKLRNVESGEVELELQWKDVPGSRFQGTVKDYGLFPFEICIESLKGNSVVSFIFLVFLFLFACWTNFI